MDVATEENVLWGYFNNGAGIGHDASATSGDTAVKLRKRLEALINSGDWGTYKKAVEACALEAGRCAKALIPILNPGAKSVDDAVFAAAVWAVKKHQESKPATMSVICSTLVS